MAIRILSTANISNTQGVKVLGYGGSGIGKTVLGATAPRPLFLSAEKGLLSIRKLAIPYIEIFSFQQLEEAHAWSLRSTEVRNFDTIVLDSVSEIAEVVLADEQTRQKDPRKLYPQYQAKMMDMLRDFRDMPQKHVYFIAKETKIQTSEGSMQASPSFPGQKLPEAAPYFFDQVFRVQIYTDPTTQQSWRGLKCQPDSGTIAKDRSGTLNLWEQPNLSEMFRKIMAN